MFIARSSVLVTLLFSAAWSCGSSTGPMDFSFLAFTSPAGEFIGAGQTERYVLEDGIWDARYVRDVPFPHVRVSIQLFDSGAEWILWLAAPSGQDLIPGTYEMAQRFPFNSIGRPGVSFSGMARGCNEVDGRFVLHSLTRGAGSNIARLSASFEQRCRNSTVASPLRGEVSIVADPWR